MEFKRKRLEQNQEKKKQELETKNRIEELKWKAKEDTETIQLKTELAVHMNISKESGQLFMPLNEAAFFAEFRTFSRRHCCSVISPPQRFFW